MAVVPRPPVALYVHVPFCVSHCPYCDFVVLSGRDARGPASRIDAWAQAVVAEARLRAQSVAGSYGDARPPLRSVYIGGGTPSLLTAHQLGALLEALDRGFGIAADAEITLEAVPGPDELGDLRGFRAAGVGRLSLGAQSMQPSELRTLGRRHGPRDVLAAIEAAREAGLERVSVDLLYDVPGQTEATWRATLETIVEAGIDHVSAYALTLEDPDADGSTGPLGDRLPVRPGARAWRDRARAAQDEDRAALLYALADERLTSAGLPWYEISNWARLGQESRHNLAYWRSESFEALGPGAHAFDGATRRWNAARLDRYVAALTPVDGSAARLPPGGSETLDEPTARADAAMLALRTRAGLRADALVGSAADAAVGWGLREGLLERADEAVVLTRRGRLLASELFVRLLPAAPLAA